MAGSTAYKADAPSITSCAGVCSGRGHPLWRGATVTLHFTLYTRIHGTRLP
jgi:hypothetical protein